MGRRLLRVSHPTRMGMLSLWDNVLVNQVEATITWDFEGGRFASAKRVGPDHWECAVAGDTDVDGRNRSSLWFAAELRGLGGKRVTLDLVDLAGEWNLRPSLGWGIETHPVIAPGPSTLPPESRPWRRLRADEVAWEGTSGAERLRLIVAVPEHPSGTATIAYIEPYTYADHRRFIARVRQHHADAVKHRVLGHSVEGRAIDLLTLGPDRPDRDLEAIWVVFRQHPWETYSSYAAEGFVDYLLSHQEVRDRFVWQLVPMVNVDGCAHGHTRHNTLGKDPNREWNQESPTPEVACIRQAIDEALGGTPVFFLDVHNNNQQTVDYLALTNLSFGASQEEATVRQETWQALIDRIAANLSSRSHFEGTVRRRSDPAPYGPPVATNASTRAGKPFSFPSALLEMRTGPLPTRKGAYGTLADQRRLGAAIAESLFRRL